jgi:hypothetical protein
MKAELNIKKQYFDGSNNTIRHRITQTNTYRITQSDTE